MISMKLLKIFSIIVVTILGLFLLFHIYFSITSFTPEQFISNDFIFIFQSNNILKLMEMSDKTPFFDPLIYNNKIKNLYESINDLKTYIGSPQYRLTKYLNSKVTMVIYQGKSPLFIFNFGLKNILLKSYFSFINKFFNITSGIKIKRLPFYNIYEITILWNKSKFYLAFVKNIVLYSYDKNLIIKSFNNFLDKNNLYKNDDFLHSKYNLKGNKTLKLYVNIKKIKNSSVFLNNLSIAGFSIDLHSGYSLIKGFNTLKFYNDKLLYNKTYDPNILYLLPEDTIQFITFAFDNIQETLNFTQKYFLQDRSIKRKIYKIKKDVKKYFGMSIDKLLFSWLGNEICIANLKNKGSIILFKINNITQAKKTLKLITKNSYFTEPDITYYKQIKIYQLTLPFLYNIFVKIFKPETKLPYYTIWNNYLIISDNKRAIKHLIDYYKKDRLLFYSDNMFQILEKNNIKANIYGYNNLKLGKINLFKKDNFLLNIAKNYNKHFFSIQFINGGIEENILLMGAQKKLRLLPNWPHKIKGNIIGTPVVGTFDNPIKNKLLIGTSDGNLTLLNVYGKIAYGWPRKIGNNLFYQPIRIKLKNKIYITVLDYNGNIYIFSTKGRLHRTIENRNSFSIAEPIAADINSDNSDDLIFCDNKGIIHCYDILRGREQVGFPYETYSIILQMKLINFNRGDKYFILSTADNKIIFLKYNGTSINKEWEIKLKELAGFDEYSNRIVALTKDGEIIFVNKKNGNIKLANQLKKKFFSPPIVDNIDSRGRYEIISIATDGTLFILDSKGKIFYKKETKIKLAKNKKIVPFDINHDFKKEIFIPSADGNTYVCSIKGDVIYKIKGNNTPTIIDINRNELYNVITTTLSDNKIFLYEFPYN